MPTDGDDMILSDGPSRRCSLKRILLLELLPVLVLLTLVIVYIYIGGAIFVKLEGDLADSLVDKIEILL